MEDNNQQDQQNQSSDDSLQKLQDDFENAMNNWKRTAADFENYKKRKESEQRELVEFAREVTVAKLLPALDSLEQALKHMPKFTPTTPNFAKASSGEPSANADTPPSIEKDAPRSSPPFQGGVPGVKPGEVVGAADFAKQYNNWQTGVSGIVIQLDKALEELGVKKIEALGKKFDPHVHEAVKEAESDAEDGTIIEELQSGFMLNGKVVRASQVVISKKK